MPVVQDEDRPEQLEGRRERKKRETRRALRSHALRLSLDKGPDNVSVEEIADAADVSVRTFFNYFSSKEEALIAWDADLRAELAGAVRDRPPAEPPLAALRHAIADLLDGFEDKADERAMRIRLVREHPSLLPRHLAAHAELERALAEAVAERLGIGPADAYPMLVVASAVAAMRVALNRWDALDHRAPLPALLDECFEALAAGLAPPRGRKR